MKSKRTRVLVTLFLLMIVGLYITFFCQPVLVRLDSEGCAVGGPKPEGMHILIQGWLEETDRKEETL